MGKLHSETIINTYEIKKWFIFFLIHKADNHKLFMQNLQYFTGLSFEEYAEFTKPEKYITNAFDFTLAMRPYPNYWEDVDAEWHEVLNNLKNKE